MSNEFELVATITGTSDELGYLAADVFNDIFEEGPVPSERDFYYDVAYTDKPDLVIASSNQVTIDHVLPPVITEPPTEAPTTPPSTYNPVLELSSDTVKVKTPDGEAKLTDTLTGFPPNTPVKLKLYRKVTPIVITNDYKAQWEAGTYDPQTDYSHVQLYPVVIDDFDYGQWPPEGPAIKGYLFRDGVLLEEGVEWRLNSLTEIEIYDPNEPPDQIDIYTTIVDNTTYIVEGTGVLLTGEFTYKAPGVIIANAEWDTGIARAEYGAYIDDELVATLDVDIMFYLLDSYPSS